MSDVAELRSEIQELSSISTSKQPPASADFGGPEPLRVIRRNGKVTSYDDTKIRVAMTKAFLAVEGESASSSNRVHEVVAQLTEQITQTFLRRAPMGGTLHIEQIQDMVELILMRSGEHNVARSYVLYREERRRLREREAEQSTAPIIMVSLEDGTLAPLNQARLSTVLREACMGLEGVSAEKIHTEALRNLYDGIPLREVNQALVMCARPFIETDYNFTFVTARLLLDRLRQEALSYLGVANEATQSDMKKLYLPALSAYLERGIQNGILDPRLKKFDWDRLGKAILSERDLDFTYLGLQTLYDRYFIHDHGVRYELPQVFFMRVAMGLALEEKDMNGAAIEFYRLLSSFDFMSSTPTLFNSGTVRPQLSSCFLTTVPDDLFEIFSAVRDNAMLSKFAGGLGNDWTPVRAMGADIKGTNGKSLGVVPFLNVANATAVAVNQGGKRKGAVCAYLETWHLDVEEFLELRKNTGDERRRTHDMNTANWVPDLFLKRVHENAPWTLFTPNEVPDLHDLTGDAFEKAYVAYEAKAARGDIHHFKTVSALNLWRKMLSLLFETGHPWITFKDPCNLRSPQQHVGVIHSSNLCTEITLNTSLEEIAVCNLGSINLAQHISPEGELNTEKLRTTVRTAIRMLDNVIDVNYYTVPQAKNSNMKHRPIGLGIMGFQDALYQKKIAYTSDAAIEFADVSMETISYYAIEASSELAKERGPYASYQGSLWSQGILPIDSIEILAKSRGGYLEQDRTQRLDWTSLREHVKKYGMRNSNTMAIAPTATISNICGVSQSIEPTYQNLYVKSNMSGEFTVVNPYLLKELKQRGLWDPVMVNDLKYFNGSVAQIDRIPADLKALFATAFEIDPLRLVTAASRRQKWLDQAQSLNLYMAEPSGKKLDTLYRQAWREGLKTTYYLRTMGATHAEKYTISDNALNAVKMTDPAASNLAACAIDNPDCEACQ